MFQTKDEQYPDFFDEEISEFNVDGQSTPNLPQLSLNLLGNQSSSSSQEPCSSRTTSTPRIKISPANSGTSKKKKKKDKPAYRTRTRINETQLGILRQTYAITQLPGTELKKHLAEMTGLTTHFIRVWFENNRFRDKQRRSAGWVEQHEQSPSETNNQEEVGGTPMSFNVPVLFVHDEEAQLPSTSNEVMSCNQILANLCSTSDAEFANVTALKVEQLHEYEDIHIIETPHQAKRPRIELVPYSFDIDQICGFIADGRTRQAIEMIESSGDTTNFLASNQQLKLTMELQAFVDQFNSVVDRQEQSLKPFVPLLEVYWALNTISDGLHLKSGDVLAQRLKDAFNLLAHPHEVPEESQYLLDPNRRARLAELVRNANLKHVADQCYKANLECL